MATGLTGDAAAYRRLLVALSPQSDAKIVAGLAGRHCRPFPVALV